MSTSLNWPTDIRADLWLRPKRSKLWSSFHGCMKTFIANCRTPVWIASTSMRTAAFILIWTRSAISMMGICPQVRVGHFTLSWWEISYHHLESYVPNTRVRVWMGRWRKCCNASQGIGNHINICAEPCARTWSSLQGMEKLQCTLGISQTCGTSDSKLHHHWYQSFHPAYVWETSWTSHAVTVGQLSNPYGIVTRSSYNQRLSCEVASSRLLQHFPKATQHSSQRWVLGLAEMARGLEVQEAWALLRHWHCCQCPRAKLVLHLVHPGNLELDVHHASTSKRKWKSVQTAL